MQVSLALWPGVPARCAVPAPESAKRHTRKVPPIGGSRNCPNRAKAQPGGELGSFQPAISPRLPKCGHCLWMLPERKDGAGLAQPIRMHRLHCVWLRLLADAIFKLARCSWRGSNPRPWAHKTHALTTRPQERRLALGKRLLGRVRSTLAVCSPTATLASRLHRVEFLRPRQEISLISTLWKSVIRY